MVWWKAVSNTATMGLSGITSMQASMPVMLAGLWMGAKGMQARMPRMTTLIRKMLKEVFAGEKTVLIENEFGEIGIDGGFLKEAGVQITEMNSGCICCSLVGDFGAALKEVIETYAPDRILIEPSGVGKLSDVTKAVQGVAAQEPVELNSSVTVVDGQKCRMYMKNFGEFFNNQVEHAGTIVISRTQKMSEALHLPELRTS